MIPIEVLSDAFARNIEILQMQTENLSHQDSLIQLPFRANCLNWVVGHVLTNRFNILRLLDAEDLIPEVDLDHYQRESEPILENGKGVLDLEDLVSLLEKSQIDLSTILQEKTPEALQLPAVYRDRPERPLAGWLFFLYFHDCYHVGQTELLRQAAGKDDKVI
ncbi:MAG: DinB family protein [Anaerolineales bacterium]|nr:DinB family protein [Anaerolineales bacterium]